MAKPARPLFSDFAAIQIDLKGIGTSLKDRRLAVPVYQRSFAWEDENVRDLYVDITSSLDNKEGEYFLGSVVAAGPAGFMQEIVDGQQRLATTTILIASIRDYFLQSGDDATAADIERDYLLQTDIRTRTTSPRLKLNEFDNDFFLKRVLSRPGSDGRAAAPTKESHRRIASASEVATDHIKALVQTSSRPRDRLLDLFEFISEKAKVIWVTVPDHANAFVIFETLNDRGLDLAISDLLKNYLFLLAESRLPEVQQNWTSMLGILESGEDQAVVVDFIRHLWSSFHGATRERELYAAIKGKVTAQQGAVDFAHNLARGAGLYTAVLNPDSAIWVQYGPNAREYMRTIGALRLVQMRPLLLAVLDRFVPREVERALRLMVSWGVRLLMVGGGGAGVFEAHYANRAKEIRSGTIASGDELGRQMSAVVPNDAVFEAAFTTANVSRAALARYYLLTLERKLAGTQPEFVPNANQAEVNLEHVLPQIPSAAWAHIPPEVAKATYNRLGNLCLLPAGSNSAIGNVSFSEKRAAYLQSQLKLTEMVGQQTNWGPAEIESRQKFLAQLAVKAWSLQL